MSYRVAFYCPDRHIVYDGRTPERSGVGGGITIRIRAATALARAGCDISVICNCRRRTRWRGVLYLPLDDVERIRADVVVLNTTGGDLDLGGALEIDIQSGLKLVWVQGTPRPKHLEATGCDFIYVPSNFIRGVVKEQWGIAPSKIFVTYNGYEESDFARASRRARRRDPHRLVYFSHPSKGMETALDVLSRLRDTDPRFHLMVFGGPRLWGDADGGFPTTEGVVYGGMIGQRRLARELFSSTFSICLQDRPEPFGMVVTESMRAGCVVLASAVGAYPELIRHGENGFIIGGDHRQPEVRSRAAALVKGLAEAPDVSTYIRSSASTVRWDTDTMVRGWIGHWASVVAGSHPEHRQDRGCSRGFVSCGFCGGRVVSLADGHHCLECARYASSGHQRQTGTTLGQPGESS